MNVEEKSNRFLCSTINRHFSHSINLDRGQCGPIAVGSSASCLESGIKSVLYIAGASNPFKIAKSIVGFITVFMIPFHRRWGISFKRLQNQTMDQVGADFSVLTKPYGAITVDARFQHVARSNVSDPSVCTNLIQILIADNKMPMFS